MPFRCKCGRTFEKLDTFGSHTSGCAPFHNRRISTSDILTMASNNNESKKQLSSQQHISNNKEDNAMMKKRLSIQTDPTLSYFNQRFILLSPLNKSNNDQQQQYFNNQDHLPSSSPVEATPPRSAPPVVFEGYGGFMMPTALSIQNTFEGVRKRRSLSYSSSTVPTDSPAAVGAKAAAAFK